MTVGVAADERQLGGDAGVGHDHVEPAERGRPRPSTAASTCVAVGHVARRATARRRTRAATSASSSGSSPASATRAPRSWRRRGEGGADAARGAGDEHPAAR